MMIYNLQLIIQLYLYLYYFHGVYVALSFLKYVIKNCYDCSIYIISYFKSDEYKQIDDIKIEMNEIEDNFIILDRKK